MELLDISPTKGGHAEVNRVLGSWNPEVSNLGTNHQSPRYTVLVGFFANLIQANIVWKEETSFEKLFPSNWPVGHFLD